ncbi:GDP-mannose transporter into the lumen of the Golgi [Ascosphaera atra]|nr:GDP-mannose transporter into the lumen of the Golgi [Ascosphaera atra]
MADTNKKDDAYVIDVEKDKPSSDRRPSPPRSSPSSASHHGGSQHTSSALPILSYCGSSILMTVANKYVLSGLNFNMNFLLLCVQSVVCIATIQTCKSMKIITYRDFSRDEARKWFPISLLLIGMIYTGAKALQFLSIPVYTIFKNLTIILIAYGEVLWFGGSVTPMTLFSFGLMVLSSIIAAWADIRHALESAQDATATDKISTLNAGYVWMMINCLCTASYVLGMRKRIKLTNFKDFDSKSHYA